MLCDNRYRKKNMINLILATNPALFIGILTITVTIVFGFILTRIVDHAINQNVKILQELMAIRKEMDNTNPDARKMDEIITYRRKRYLKRQIESCEKMKQEDKEEEAKAVLRGNNIRKNFWWKVANNQVLLGVRASIWIFTFCVCFSIVVAGGLQILLR
jgi:hypothetical protein